ncbi:MAG TPA: RNA polymerase sigma factor [Ktedonobacteraceae bacterium]|nr:RNA polymerase sigma factor [Ktedonobacteraceae bacterium]
MTTMTALMTRESETSVSQINHLQPLSLDTQIQATTQDFSTTYIASQEKLVTRALQGEQEAFNDIVTQYSAMMLRTASMIVGDRDTAEDVVQDALIQVWHHLPELREAGALRSWLMRIVVNQCISFKRKVTRSAAFMRQSLMEQETDMLAQIADDHKGRRERDWDIAQAIGKLPTKQRIVIVLHYYYGMTLPEMAQTLHTSENTLKKRIQAALTNLRRNFYGAYWAQ